MTTYLFSAALACKEPEPYFPENGIKLLVLDKEPEVLQMMREYFTSHGFEVQTACSADAGRVLCRKFMPQVIVMDLRLEGMEGEKILPLLIAECPEAKILIVSAYHPDEVEEKLRPFKTHGYFQKPVSIFDLEKHICRLLRS